MKTLLIRNGTVLDPSTGRASRSDVLVADGVICDVAPGIEADAEVLDAIDRIVLPGFVDTHRHVWQSLLRGVAPDVSLDRYLELVLGRFGPRYTAADIGLANLLGALECLDAGITTVFDWSHLQLTPAHTDAAIDGLRQSGIRAVFGYARLGQADGRLDETELRRVRREIHGLVSLAIGATGPESGDRPSRLCRNGSWPVTSAYRSAPMSADRPPHSPSSATTTCSAPTSCCHMPTGTTTKT